MVKQIRLNYERAAKSAAVLAVVGLVLAIGIFSPPADKNDDLRDFSEFYCAAQIVANGLGESLYNLDLQAEFISRVAAVHTFYNHPPFETLLFVPLTFFTYRTAFRLWLLTSAGLLLAATWLIESRTQLSLAITKYTGIRADFGLVLAIFLTFAPATTCLLTGQDSMLTLIIYTLVFVLLKRDNQFTAGCVLAAGLFKFQFILPFIFILALRRKWSVIKGFSLIAGLLVGGSIAISGLQVLWGYPRFLLFDSRYLQVAGFQPEFMPNVRGIVHLLLHRWEGTPFPLVIIVVCSLLILWLAARNWRDEEFETSFSTAVIAVLLTSYHLYNYDLTLLLLPAAILCSSNKGRVLSSSRLAIAALVVLFAHPLHRALVQYSIYAVMSLPVAVLFAASLRNPLPFPRR